MALVEVIVATRKMAADKSSSQVRSPLSWSEKIVKDILTCHHIKKDKDVEELYLANKGLTDVHDLQRFHFLKILWLNGNKLRQVSSVKSNLLLSELYLQNNELSDISGSIGHLTCLKICMLHNNQLTKLDKVTQEFKRMLDLHTLNLIDNPIAQEPEYRLFLIQSCPSVQLLDRQVVKKQERVEAQDIYNYSRKRVQEKIAFGRLSQGPPSLCYPGTRHKIVTKTSAADGEDVANNFLKNKLAYEDPEEAVRHRQLNKALTVYTSFNWAKAPRILQRRTSDDLFENPEIITRVYH